MYVRIYYTQCSHTQSMSLLHTTAAHINVLHTTVT